MTLAESQKERRKTFYHSTLCDARHCNRIAEYACPVPDLHVGSVLFHVCSDHYDDWIGSRTDYIHGELKPYNALKG